MIQGKKQRSLQKTLCLSIVTMGVLSSCTPLSTFQKESNTEKMVTKALTDEEQGTSNTLSTKGLNFLRLSDTLVDYINQVIIPTQRKQTQNPTKPKNISTQTLRGYKQALNDDLLVYRKVLKPYQQGNKQSYTATSKNNENNLYVADVKTIEGLELVYDSVVKYNNALLNLKTSTNPVMKKRYYSELKRNYEVFCINMDSLSEQVVGVYLKTTKATDSFDIINFINFKNSLAYGSEPRVFHLADKFSEIVLSVNSKFSDKNIEELTSIAMELDTLVQHKALTKNQTYLDIHIAITSLGYSNSQYLLGKSKNDVKDLKLMVLDYLKSKEYYVRSYSYLGVDKQDKRLYKGYYDNINLHQDK